MGFLEILRQQKEREQAAAAAAAEATERDRIARSRAAAEKRRQEIDFRRARKKDAESYFNKSGVEHLILSLSRLVNPGLDPETARLYPGPDPIAYWYTGRLDVPWHKEIPTIRSNYLPPMTLASDPDSVSYGIVWNVKEGHDRKSKDWIGTETEGSTYRTEMIGHPGSSVKSQSRTLIVGYTASWYEYVANFIVVEIQPDGDVVFHSHTDHPVPYDEWHFYLPLRQTTNPLETALEHAYRDPRVERYNAFYNVSSETINSSRWSPLGF